MDGKFNSILSIYRVSHIEKPITKTHLFQTPLLVCANGPFRSFLEANIPLVQNKFWPTLWCFESRAQTIIASLLRSKILPYVKYRRLVEGNVNINICI